MRFEAAKILMMLLSDNAQLYNYWKSYVDKFNVPEKHSFDHDEALLAVIHKTLKHLLNMLEEFPSLTIGMSFHKRKGSVAVYPRNLRAYRKKKTSPDCLKIKKNCMETLDFSISIHIKILQYYINAFTCS